MRTVTLFRLFPPVAALFALLLAIYWQHAFEATPCALCVVQRYAYFGILLLGLLQLFIRAFFLRAGLLVFGLLGSIAAAYQLWVLAHPAAQCGSDALEPYLNNLIFARWVPEVFYASGFCFEEFAPIWGLSLPAWSIVGMLAITCCVLVDSRKV